VLAVSCFVFFRSFYAAQLSGYAGEILAALIGVIFTATVMTMLLTFQSRGEEIKERNVEIFRAKLTLYKEFVESVLRIVEDGKVDKAEVAELRQWFFRLSLVAGRDVLEKVGRFIDQLEFCPVLSLDLMPQGKLQEWEERDQEFCSWHLVIEKLRDDIGVAAEIPAKDLVKMSSAVPRHTIGEAEFRSRLLSTLGASAAQAFDRLQETTKPHRIRQVWQTHGCVFRGTAAGCGPVGLLRIQADGVVAFSWFEESKTGLGEGSLRDYWQRLADCVPGSSVSGKDAWRIGDRSLSVTDLTPHTEVLVATMVDLLTRMAAAKTHA